LNEQSTKLCGELPDELSRELSDELSKEFSIVDFRLAVGRGRKVYSG
jgi:hypothetical protein